MWRPYKAMIICPYLRPGFLPLTSEELFEASLIAQLLFSAAK